MLAGIAQALRPDGVYLCVDTSASSKLAENVEHPLGPFLYTVSCMHCMTVSLADGGMGLGTMWGEDTARKMLSDAGFASIEAVHIDAWSAAHVRSAAEARAWPAEQQGAMQPQWTATCGQGR